jgi:hypothetical protein
VVETACNKDCYRGRWRCPPWSSGCWRWLRRREFEILQRAGTSGEVYESKWRKRVYRQLDFCLFQELRKEKRFDLAARVSSLIETKRYFRILDTWMSHCCFGGDPAGGTKANGWRCSQGADLALKGYGGLLEDLGGTGIRAILFVTWSCWGGRKTKRGKRGGSEN